MKGNHKGDLSRKPFGSQFKRKTQWGNHPAAISSRRGKLLGIWEAVAWGLLVGTGFGCDESQDPTIDIESTNILLKNQPGEEQVNPQKSIQTDF